MALVVVLAGGGSAGHVVPALALAAAIRNSAPDATLRFVGTQRGQETRLVPGAGYTLDVVPSEPVLGRSPLGMARAALALLRGFFAARALLGRVGPDLVIGVGGYASVPAVLAAASRRIPIALVEPNAQPGRANRLLGRFAQLTCVQFDDAIPFFPSGRAQRLGFPVRAIPPRGDAAPGTLRLLIIGGSQGARTINRAMAAGLRALGALDGLQVTHQTGKLDLEEVRKSYADEPSIVAEIDAFFDDLPDRLARADVLVARAGASTIAEACLAGVPSILVPLPLADDHQLANARELERAGGCIVVENGDAPERLVDTVLALVADPDRRRALGTAAATRAQPDAAARIWDACRELVTEEAA